MDLHKVQHVQFFQKENRRPPIGHAHGAASSDGAATARVVVAVEQRLATHGPEHQQRVQRHRHHGRLNGDFLRAPDGDAFDAHLRRGKQQEVKTRHADRLLFLQ